MSSDEESWKRYMEELPDEELQEIEAAVQVLMEQPKFREEFGMLGVIGHWAWYERMKREHPELEAVE